MSEQQSALPRQPVPKVTPEDVERVVRRDFAVHDQTTVLAILGEYGTESWHREYARVQLAALKLADGDVEKLRKAITTAKRDYRDALAVAEYPAYSRRGFQTRKLPAEEYRRIVASDWQQYEAWLGRP